MELESIITNSPWSIVEALARGEKSPSEIAKETGVSLATISQQAKLLAAYNLITVAKATARGGPGKPKQTYALSKELAFIAMARKGFAGKRTFKLDDVHKALFNTLFLERNEDQYYLGKFLWEREESLQQCEALAVSDSNNRELHLLVIADDAHLEKLRKEISTTTIKHVQDKKEDRKVICWTHTLAEVKAGLERNDEYFRKLLAHPHVIIDRKNVLQEFT
jgi:predicted transcriptional regulator